MALTREPIKHGATDREPLSIEHQKISASSFYIERGLLAYLEEYANMAGCTKHDAMRRAVMEFMEKNPVMCEASTEKFLEFEIEIENLLRSVNSNGGNIRWKVKLYTELNRIIYRYSLSKCPFCGEPLSIIELTEDMGAGKVHAVILCNSPDSAQCQKMLDAILFKERST
jgi:hypothetical protein